MDVCDGGCVGWWFCVVLVVCEGGFVWRLCGVVVVCGGGCVGWWLCVEVVMWDGNCVWWWLCVVVAVV